PAHLLDLKNAAVIDLNSISARMKEAADRVMMEMTALGGQVDRRAASVNNLERAFDQLRQRIIVLEEEVVVIRSQQAPLHSDGNDEHSSSDGSVQMPRVNVLGFKSAAPIGTYSGAFSESLSSGVFLNTNPIATVDQLVADLKATFENELTGKLKEAQFSRCRQERGESIETYFNRVRLLAAQAFRAESSEVMEKRSREAFLNGLDDSIRYNVKDKDPKTCREAFDEAIRQDILREDRAASQQYLPTVALLEEMRSMKQEWANYNNRPGKPHRKEKIEDNQKMKRRCYHCNNVGHFIRDCRKRMAGEPKVQQTNQDAVRNHQQHPAQVKVATTEDLQAQLEVYRQQIAELQRVNGALMAESGTHGVRSLTWPTENAHTKKSKANFTVNSAHWAPVPLTMQIPIKVNGTPCFALIDTGSTITVAGQAFSRRIGVPRLHQASAPHAIGLGGNEVQMVGAAFVTVAIGSHTIVHRVHFTKGECTPEGPRNYGIILGNDLLSQIPQFSINYKQATFNIGDESIPIGSRHVAFTPQVFDIKVSENTVIPAHSEGFIRCTKQTTADVRASVFLVASQSLLDKCLLTAPAVMNSENMYVYFGNKHIGFGRHPYTRHQSSRATDVFEEEDKRYNFPLPRIDSILEKVGGSKFFSSLDMANGYLQLRLDPESSYKCGFTTEDKVYAYTHLPFGLRSAASYFQRAMRTVLVGMEQDVMMYIDDVLVFSKSFESHVQTLRKVLTRFREYNLKASPAKCEFAKKSIVFLGHEISETNYSPNQANLDAIQKMPIPRDLKAVQRFVGMAGFFRKFIKNFSEIAEPLTKLTRKDQPFEWTSLQQNAFETLKDKLTSKPILVYPDYTKEFHIYTDASAVAQGAVLAQVSKDAGIIQVVAYGSRTLSEVETRRPAIQIELGAIVFALRHFKPYIWLSKIVLHTDHRPLVHILAKSKVNERIARWLIEIQQYDISIVHIDGKRNTVADCISRAKDEVAPLPKEELEDIIEFPVCMKIDRLKDRVLRNFTPGSTQKPVDLAHEQDKDNDVNTIKTFLTSPATTIDGISEKWLPFLERVRVSETEEAQLALFYAKGLRKVRPDDSICILASKVYKSTCTYIEENAPEKVRCSTVDGVQGREYDYTIVLTSRTSGAQTFLDDKKRINVAISRTKTACIIMGNVPYLRSAHTWNQLFNQLPRECFCAKY
uniref:CCHC-type domain-containing protein n=1 Tax=Caenorhabditis japonica TaxID=281687 RepID=A0A8R1HVX8_CAEJA